jgi:DNA-binding transcriptional regulator YbjK
MKQEILDVAIKLVEANGLRKVEYPARVLSKENIADELGIAMGSINYYWGSTKLLIDAVLRHAIKTKNTSVIAWGLLERHPIALKAPASLKSQAAKVIAA